MMRKDEEACKSMVGRNRIDLAQKRPRCLLYAAVPSKEQEQKTGKAGQSQALSCSCKRAKKLLT